MVTAMKVMTLMLVLWSPWLAILKKLPRLLKTLAISLLPTITRTTKWWSLVLLVKLLLPLKHSKHKVITLYHYRFQRHFIRHWLRMHKNLLLKRLTALSLQRHQYRFLLMARVKPIQIKPRILKKH